MSVSAAGTATRDRADVRDSKRRKLYTQADLDDALRLAYNEGMGLAYASEVTGVPLRTIKYRRANPLAAACPGPKTVLSELEEMRLVEYFIKMANLGLGLTRDAANEQVLKIVDDGRKHPWTDGKIPGKDWWIGFFERHPGVSMRTAEKLVKQRAVQDNTAVYTHYYDLLDKLMTDRKFLKRNIWNADETMWKPKQPRVLAKKGTGTVNALVDDPWQHVSLLMAVNAEGGKMPPLIIMTGKTVMEKWTTCQEIPGTIYTATDSGWITRDVYTVWFTEFFVPHINATRGVRADDTREPVLYLFDGHDSHLSIEVALLAEAHGIDLLQMPPHTSHRLQVLDKTCYGPFHQHIGKALNTYRGRHPRERITRDKVAELIKPGYEKGLSSKNIVSGFEICLDRTRVLPKLSSNSVNSVLTPAVVMDPHPVQGLVAATPAPVLPTHRRATPPELLRKKSRTSLVRDIERLQRMLAEAEEGRVRAENARLQESLRLPLADIGNAAPAVHKKGRSIGALRAKDGKARLVTSAQLRRDLAEVDNARKEKAVAKTATSAAKAGKKSRKPRQTTELGPSPCSSVSVAYEVNENV